MAALQSLLALYPSGVLDEATLVRVRGLRASAGLPVRDVVDADTAIVAGERARTLTGVPPVWFPQDAARICTRILGDSGEDAVRRFQSGRGLRVTGVVDVETAIALGD